MHLTAEFDLGQFPRVRTRVVNASERVVQQAVEKTTRDALRKAKEGRFKDRTGDLRKEIYPVTEGWNGGTYWGLVISPTKYARFVEYPTKPHEIWPKAAHGSTHPLHDGQTRRATGKGPHEYIVGRGYALRWVNGTGEHFARMVNHPGTEGQKYMYAASIVASTTLRMAIRDGFATLTTVH